MVSLATSREGALQEGQTETRMDQIVQLNHRKKNVLSSQRLLMCQPPQTIDRFIFFLHRHMVFCVILGWSAPDERGGVGGGG